jgi:hypothetical protein
MLSAPSALGALDCGDSITKDRKLKADLDCSAFAGNALEIASNGVTLDLNGHTLTGIPSAHYGIDASGGANRIKVKNGTIEGFYHAVELLGNRKARLSKLRIELALPTHDYGVYAGETRRLSMRNIEVSNPLYGFYLYENRRLKLRKSEVAGADVYIGVNADGSGRIDDVEVTGAEYGFYLYEDLLSAILKVTDSKATNGEFAGFNIGNGNERKSIFVQDNVAKDNDQYGFYAPKRPPGDGNRASGNGTEDCHNVKCD